MGEGAVTQTIILNSVHNRRTAMDLIHLAPDGHVAEIRQARRSDAQNRLMWALIRDMRNQNEGMRAFDPDQVKLRFLNALNNEMTMLPEIWGGGQFVAGQRSSKLTKAQFSDLVELMLKYGAENQIEWSRESRTYAAENNIEMRS